MFFFFFFNDTATTEIYTLSLHDALPIYCTGNSFGLSRALSDKLCSKRRLLKLIRIKMNLQPRSEEHTSELQSQSNLVCRLLLEKKNKKKKKKNNNKKNKKT